MEVPSDAVSVVTNTTRDSDETHQGFDIVLSGIHGLKDNYSHVHRPQTPNYEALVTDSCDSPMYPVQQSIKVQLKLHTRNNDRENCTPDTKQASSDSLSEVSQPLIPLVQKGQLSNSARKMVPSRQKQADLEDASQSLLPQTVSERSQLHGFRGRMFNVPFSLKHPSSLTRPESDLVQLDLARTTQSTDSSKGDKPWLHSSQREATQSTELSKGDNLIPSSRSGMAQSQQSNNATDKICIRLEKLLSSLSCSASKQKRVMEITVHQCVGKLQDNILHRLKKVSLDQKHTASMKKLLQTIQTCLTKLYQHYKAERTLVSQGKVLQGQQLSKQHTRHVIQTTLSELQQRQQELHTLLKQQKKLVEKLKIAVRSQAEDMNYGKSDTTLMNSVTATETHKIIPCPEDPQNSQLCSSQNDMDNFQFSQISNLYPYNELTQQSQTSDLIPSTQNGNQRPELYEPTNERLESTKHSGTGLSDKNAEKPTSLSQDMETIPDTQDADSIHVSPGSPTHSNDTHQSLCEQSGKRTTNTSHESKEMVKAGSSGESGMQNAFHSHQTSQPLVATTEATDLEEIGGSSKKENSIPHQQDNERVSSKGGNSLSPQQDNGRVSSKRDNSRSPQQSKNKKIRKDSSEADDKKPEETSSYSDMLWLNMLHKNKDNKNKHAMPLGSDNDQEKQKSCEANNKLKDHVDPPYGFKNQVTYKQKTSTISLLDQQYTDNNILNSLNDTNAPKTAEFSNKSKGCERPFNINIDNQTVTCSSVTRVQNKPPVFLSPPRYHMDADMADNISPTATSMSSDVFLVKAKELNRRMKMREKLADKATPVSNIGKPAQHSLQTSVESMTKLAGNTSLLYDVQKHVKDTSNITVTNDSIPLKQTSYDRDTISEAIESVVAKSRHVTADQMMKDSCVSSERVLTGVSNRYLPASCQNPQYSKEIGQKNEVKQKSGCLPSIKDLLDSRIILPGKNVLSVFIKGLLHQATITPKGKLKTREGMLLNTPMQWLSTLTDGEPKKKSIAYKQILYKGTPLINMCSTVLEKPEATSDHRSVYPPPAQTIRIIPGPQDNSKIKTFKVISTVEKAVQVESQKSTTESGRELSPGPKTDEEMRLNHRLTHSVIRLLTERDFVSCEDLPSNIWTEDYVNVRLNKAMWDIVDKW